MVIIQLIADEDDAGLRADIFISQKINDITRSAVHKLIECGAVLLAGAPIRKNYRINPGDVLTVTLNEAEEAVAAPEDIPLDIVYEDADLIVVNKPRGMVVHPAPGHPSGTLVNALLRHCGDSLSGIGGEKRPGIVHRLDKNTSGLIIAAKNDYSHRHLSQQLSSRTLGREYHAIAVGALKQDSGTVNAPIGRHQNDRKKMAVTSRNSREAITHYEILARYRGYTYIACRLETGRTHQIRVHMAHIGHPMLGDLVYGRKKAELGLSSQCLHAKALEFIHPGSGELMALNSELPDYFKEVLRKLEAISN